MRKIVVVNNVTLDGVMQAPGGKEEDPRDGFKYGGWAGPYNDEVKARIMGEGMAEEHALLFGRKTYEHFFKVFPGRRDNPFSEVLDNTQKYVASRTLRAPLPWTNSTLLAGDACDTVARLKAEPGPGITILGSGELVRALMRCDLVDELLLNIHPIVLGTGRRMLGDDGNYSRFELVRSVPTTTGVIIASYRLIGEAAAANAA